MGPIRDLIGLGETAALQLHQPSGAICLHARIRMTAPGGVAATMQNPFMVRAIELSIENVQSGRGGPFAAVVVKDGKVIAEGSNCVTSTNDPTAHAEVMAIREACRKLGFFELTGCEIYTSCEPCPMCMGAIYWARPDRIYFGNTAADAAKAGFDDSLIYQEIVQPHAERKIPMIQMMREEALEGFRAWLRKSDKVPY
jgi:guanine deaminase